MLTTRRTKRDNVGFFNMDLMLDVMDGERQLGAFVYEKKRMRATLDFGGKAYTIERLRDESPDEMLYQMVWRWLRGRPRPAPNPFLLKDAGGHTLASSLEVKRHFAIERDGARFALRRVGRPYHLYREGSTQSLGSVGQEKLLTTTLHMNLPAEFDPPFQAFLLVLLLDLTMRSADNASTT